MYSIREVSDIFTDACVRDSAGNLLFASLYGRDGALLQFFAAFSLKREEGGLDAFSIIDEHGRAHSVQVNEPNKLEKLSGRFPKANLFGNLAHAWAYDPRLVNRDYANRTAWVIQAMQDCDRHNESDLLRERAWHVMCDLSPVPLLDKWKDVLLEQTASSCIESLSESPYPPIGQVTGFRVQLDEGFIDRVSQAVRQGLLTIDDISSVT